jgi:hypothetical protein
VAERFGGGEEIDIVAAAGVLSDTATPYLVIFNNMGIAAASGAIAYEVTVRSDRSGYSDITADDRRRRQRAAPSVGDEHGALSQYRSVNDRQRRFVTGDTPLTVRDWLGTCFSPSPACAMREPVSTAVLGAQLATGADFNSESLLEGRIWFDGAGATRSS